MRQQAQTDIDASDSLIEKSEIIRQEAVDMLRQVEEKEATAR